MNLDVGLGPETTEPGDIADSLLRGSVRGGLYNVLVRGGADGIRLLSMLVLARLLTPGEFGTVAMVTVVIGVADLIQDLGLSSAAVQRHGLTTQQSSTLFWLNTALGVAGGLAVYLAADPVASLLANPDVAGVARLLAPSFLISALGTQPIAMLRRSLRFGSVARIGLLGAGLYGAVAIGLAAGGAGQYALAWALLASNAATSAAAFVSSGMRPGRPKFDRSTREMVGVGGPLFGFVVLNYVAVNIQALVIGRADGPAATGLYGRGQRLASASTGYIVGPITGVAFPVMARLRSDPNRWERYFVKAHSIVVMAVLCIAPMLILRSEEIVEVLLGRRWLGAAPVLAALGVAVIAEGIASPTGWIYESRGDTARMLRWGAVGWSVVIIGTLAGVPFGIRGVAVGYAAASVSLVGPCLWYAFRGTGLRVRSVLGDLIPVFIAAGVAALVSTIAGVLLAQTDVLPRLLAVTGTHMCLYALLLVTVANRRDLIVTVTAQLRGSGEPRTLA